MNFKTIMLKQLSNTAAGVGQIHFVYGIMNWKYEIDILKETVIESIES